MATTKPITEQVSAHIVGSELSNIPAETVETAKRLLLDGIGCLLAGTRSGPGQTAARMMARLLGGDGKSGNATIILDGRRASARDAAFVNGITLYSVGVNDIHKASASHPGGCVIPAILATGEWLESSGADLLAAMIVGYDVMGRLGRAMMPSHRECGFHPTGTFGAFASTSAIGRLLRLDQAQMTAALGIAGSQAAGLVAFQTDGSLTMVFHAGRAAQNGIEACLLAQEGFTGPRTVLEDPRGGFVASTSEHYQLEAITDRLGIDFEVDQTSFRPFYGCTYTIAASSATAEIMQREPRRRAEDIAEIKVRAHPVVVDEVGNANPETLLAARISMQFNLGLVIATGDTLVGDVTERELWDPRIRQLFPLLHFDSDTSISSWAGEVTIRFKDGTTETAQSLVPKGDPNNPMSWDDTIHKFRRLTAPLDQAAAGEKIIELVRALEHGNVAPLVRAINAMARAAG